jgi:ATP synthase F1 epsilon subunit
MTLKVCIMAPDRVFWNAGADEIILPTNTGQMGVLPNHTPLITGLDIGVMLVRPEKGSSGGATTPVSPTGWISVALMGGFALIKDNSVTILVNDAELGSSIDPVSAEKSFNEAKEALDRAIAAATNDNQELGSQSRKEKIEASLTFKRARARFQVVTQGR